MKHTSPKDIFLQLFSTAMLYLSIIAMFIATFNITNFYIRSTTNTYPSTVEQLGNVLSFPLAMLVIAFPLFIWSTRHLEQRIKKHADLAHSRAQVWLTNLTLFLAAIIITVTAITVVYNFFNGDLTTRTLIKSAMVVLVSILTIVWYKEKEDGKKDTAIVRWGIAGTGIALVVAILITGVVAMGSPKERRMMREDREVRYNLQNAYYNIESALSTNTSTLPGTIATTDRVQYTRTTETSAELCATFQTSFDQTKDDPYYSGPQRTSFSKAGERSITEPIWSHEPGENCYTIELS